MDKEIIIALIGAAAVIIAALIGLLAKNKEKSTKVKQKATGKNITQIGVQNNYSASRDGENDV